MPLPRFLVYQSYIDNDSYLAYRALRDHFGAQATGFCTAADILDGRLKDGVDLLVMPGGADLYYVEKLNGEGNRNIRAFVESGGRYLGICAGAYYACTEIEYAKGTPHEVTGARALGFFPGWGIGPAGEGHIFDSEGLPPPEILSVTHADALNRKTQAKTVHWGGPSFHAPADSSWESLATYDTLPGTPPAIVRMRPGRGCVVLSGVHPEIRAADLDAMAYEHNGSKPTLSKAAALLHTESDEDSTLWRQVLEWTMAP